MGNKKAAALNKRRKLGQFRRYNKKKLHGESSNTINHSLNGEINQEISKIESIFLSEDVIKDETVDEEFSYSQSSCDLVHSMKLNCLNSEGSNMRCKKKVDSGRRGWTRPGLQDGRRLLGNVSELTLHLENQDPIWFFEYMRMTPQQFQEIYSKVGKNITKRMAHTKCSISPQEQLAITLGYLVTQEYKISLSKKCCIGISTVTYIIEETLKVLLETMTDDYMRPMSRNDYLNIAAKFESKWDFPNCMGVIEGKLVWPPGQVKRIQNVQECERSLVLMAVVDSDYKFRTIDIISEDTPNDPSILRRSYIVRSILNREAPFPKPRDIGGFHLPYVFVASEPFPLTPMILKPFSLEIDEASVQYNKRFHRAHLVGPNAFGVLVSRWRLLQQSVTSKPETLFSILKVCCCLHNFLMKENTSYCPKGYLDYQSINGEVVEGNWRKEVAFNSLNSLANQECGDFTTLAAETRNKFIEYLSSPFASVPWLDPEYVSSEECDKNII